MSDPFNAEVLKFVSDPTKSEQLIKILYQMVSYQARSGQAPDLFITKVANWIAVPILALLDLTPVTLLERLRLKSLENRQELFAITIPKYGLPELVYNVPLTNEALKEIEILCPFTIALFSGQPDFNWLFLSLETDYFMILGASEFINEILDHKVEEEFAQFYSFFVSMINGSDPYFRFLYQQLRKYNTAEVGVKVALNP